MRALCIALNIIGIVFSINIILTNPLAGFMFLALNSGLLVSNLLLITRREEQ